MTERTRDEFSQACGLGGPLELLVKRPEEAEGRRHLFEQPFVLVGRDPHADLCLEGEQVSRRHAYLQVVAGHLFCLDLESRAGTHWDDGQRRAGWLLPGQAIRIGPYEVRLVGNGRGDGERVAAPAPEWSPIETRLPEATAGLRATVEFLRGEQVETRCRLTRVLTLVGRAPTCRLRLSSREVSPYHCALLRTAAAVWVIDLLGHGGIRANGARVFWSPLALGDRLKVGEFEMRLRSPSAAEPAPLPALRPPAPLADPRALNAVGLGPVVHELRLMQQEMFDHFQQALLTMMQMFGTVHRDQMGLIREELDRVHALNRELQTLRAEQARHAPPAAAPAAPPAPAANGDAAAGRKAPPPGPQPAARTGTAQGGDESIHLWLSQRIETLEQERQSRWQKVMSFMLGK